MVLGECKEKYITFEINILIINFQHFPANYFIHHVANAAFRREGAKKPGSPTFAPPIIKG
jgi:hypothetical protein